jgi:hypothetical protein
MPYIVTGNPTSWSQEIYTKDLGYTYPNGLDLRPDSEFHKELRSKIWERANEARMAISPKFESWREIDRSLTTYIERTDDEEELKDRDPNKPISIVFPYSFATLESLLTYLSMAFFQDPILRYEGVEDSDTIGAKLLELVIRFQCIKNKVMLNAHTVLRDSLCYGMGAAVPEWYKHWGKIPRLNQSITDSPLGTNQQDSYEFVRSILFEGNRLSNIDPYMILLDPGYSISEFQRGEFVGWIDRDNYMNLLSEENDSGGKMFNVKYLKDKKDKRSTLALDQSDRNKKSGGPDGNAMPMTTNKSDRIRMYINLIPKDWKLGSEEYPVKWYFELASDDVIVKAQSAEHAHGMYSMAIAAPEYDGYSTLPIGRMEVSYGLQHTLNFLFNSHIANVRKAINDMLVVDPYLINIEDIRHPGPGKLIRTRRPAWGHGVKDVVAQLSVQDITRANIGDASFITSFMDRILGADQSMQGAVRQSGPERLTSAEFTGTRGSAISRLQRIASIIGMQFFQDIGIIFASNTQQYMSKEVLVNITGEYASQMQAILGGKTEVKQKVSPKDIMIGYDIIPRDGSIPGGNFNDTWIDLFKIIAPSPELDQQFDVPKIFMYIAKQLGAKNVEDFRRIQTKVLPDQVVQQQAQAGNLIPINTANQ